MLKELKEVMEPVAECLDMLQGEESAYMGILLPTLCVMKTLLNEHANNDDLEYAKPLVQAVLRGYQKRLAHLFEDSNLLMATALHPNFTPFLLQKIAPEHLDVIKTRIVRALKAMIRPREEGQRQPVQSQSKGGQAETQVKGGAAACPVSAQRGQAQEQND